MKKRLTIISMSLIGFLLITFAISAILSLLSYKEIISPVASEGLSYALSIIMFLVLGIVSGFKAKKRGLLLGIILAIFYVLIAIVLRFLCLEKASLIGNIVLALRVLVLISGSVLGVNIAQKKERLH